MKKKAKRKQNLQIDGFKISNFQNIQNLDIEGLSNINLIIGKNDTGKTGILKLLYGVCRSWEVFRKKQTYDKSPFKKILGEKLFNTFQPRKVGLGELVTKSSQEKFQAEISFSPVEKKSQKINFSFGDSTNKTIVDCNADNEIVMPPADFHSVFIPAKEVLTAFRTIEYTRQQFLTGFDDTYLDLIKDLNVDVREEKMAKNFRQINKSLENLFDGTIEQTDSPERFVFKKGNKQFDMTMTAEGIKRLGIISTLIRNWQLHEGGILFLDEPDANLHPEAIYKLMHAFIDIAKTGVQIFISTHSYFVIKALEILSRRYKYPVNCISMRTEDNKLHIDQADLQNGMPENPIIDVALQLYDDEIDL